MTAYQVFKHPDKGYKAVKRGFSWPAFFFATIWAIPRGMWLRGLLLAVFEVALVALNLALGRRDWAFSLAVDVIFLLIVGVRGNLWRSTMLQDHGHVYLGAINARNPQDAVAKVAASNGTIPAELKAPYPSSGLIYIPPSLRGLFAVIGLTWKAAFRYRLFWVIAALLLCAVVGLPILVKDDGTARGFAQILITYTLGAITGLLGLCTLWLACGTLARDVEESQIQMVVVKPIPRWQVWLGKWLGLVSLNAALLAVAGSSIYGLLEWRAQRLSPGELAKLQNEVLVARAGVKPESLDSIVEKETNRRFQEQLAKGKLEGANQAAVHQQMEAQVKALLQVVPPGEVHYWVVHLGRLKERAKDQQLFLRVKFNSASASAAETFYAEWQVGNPEKMTPWRSDTMSLSPDTFHEFPVEQNNLFDANGDMIILFHNPNPTALLFPFDEGMEVLYRESSFGINFIRGLGIILCWMSLLAALGLASASFFSFPVAALVSLSALGMSFSTGTLSTVVSQGTIAGWDSESSTYGHSPADYFVVPLFRAALKVINLAKEFSPIDSLTTGRSITWEQLGMAVVRIVLLLGGIIGVFGIFVFNRRELAAAQGTS